MLGVNITKLLNDSRNRDTNSGIRDGKFRVYLDIAEQIAKRRNQLGMSQRKLAKLLSTSHPTIVRWEAPGYSGYTISKLVETAKALGCKIEVRLVPEYDFSGEIQTVSKVGRPTLVRADNRIVDEMMLVKFANKGVKV